MKNMEINSQKVISPTSVSIRITGNEVNVNIDQVKREIMNYF